MKRVVTLTVIIMIATVSGSWADTVVDVYVNGKKQHFDPAARVREGTTYAPLRAASEAVGAEVHWIAAQQLATVCKGKACAMIRKEQGIIISGRLLIPLRLMAEALDAEVSWDGERRAVMIEAEVAETQQDKVSRRLLQRMLATYEGAKTFQAEGRNVTWTRMPGMKMEMEMPVEIAYQAPNHLRQISGIGMYKQACISDGEDLFLSSGMSRRVARAPAPKTLGEITGAIGAGLFSQQSGGKLVETLSFDKLIAGDFDLEDVKQVRAGLQVDSEWLASLKDPPSTWVVTVWEEQGPPVVVWIDQDHYLLRQVAVEVSGEEMQAQMAATFGNSQGPGAMPFMDWYKEMTIRMLMTREKISVDQPVPEATFSYRPPEEIEIVEADSASEIQRALLGASFGDMTQTREEGPEPEASELVGQSPPDFTAQNLEGESVQLSQFRGQPTIVDFGATWCPPCRRGMPILDEIYQEYHNQGLQVIIAFLDRDMDEVKSYLENNPVNCSVLWIEPGSDAAKVIDNEYGVSGIPRTIFINADWQIAADVTGLHSKADLLETIRELGDGSNG